MKKIDRVLMSYLNTLTPEQRTQCMVRLNSFETNIEINGGRIETVLGKIDGLDDLDEIRVNGDQISAKINIEHNGLLWNVGRLSLWKQSYPIPATIVGVLAGHVIGDLIMHPHIPADMRIKNAFDNGPWLNIDLDNWI